MAAAGADRRPSFDALLEAARRDGRRERGRLKIFLGAAPGVGKTYEMLETARAKRQAGADVVVGAVETHGRRETAALLDGFEVIVRRRSEESGRLYEEMDLDALIARRPGLALVDELAHTNAPGSRHPKRYLDVEELIEAGIDVYTTLNIQHVESLNDVVARITRIRVRETVPDRVLDGADDIEVVDLAPDDLIRRLEEGKVYVPKQAERALRHYFSRGNLTALRELALRCTADRVDDELVAHMRAHAIEGPWPAGERVLVCVGEDPRSVGLVRAGKRLADRLHAPWTALSIETTRSQSLEEAERQGIAEALRLAERLGAEAVTLPGGARGRIAEDILAFARERNATSIVVGKSTRSRWFEILHGSIVHELVRAAGPISVHVMAGEAADRRPAKAAEATAKPRIEALLPFTAALVAIAVALGLALIARPVLGVETADLIFLAAIVGTSVRFGLWPSLLACAAASLAYNFFFLPPFYTFTIAEPANVAALFIFLLVAVLVSNLAALVRSQALTAQSRARTTEALYSFSRKIAGVASLDDLLWAACYQIASMLKLDTVILLPDDGSLAVRAGYPPEDELDGSDLGAAKWAFETGQPAGRGSDTLPGARRLFLPMVTAQGAVGVVGLFRRDAGPLLTVDSRRLLDALADQAAVAIERLRLSAEMEATRVEAESERLRAALLTSLSHDLKTPLASILGAVTSLRRYGDLFDASQRDELAATIEEESERLSRFVANLLDMTRLESGPILLDRQPTDIAEVIGTTLERSARTLSRHRVETDIEPNLPMLTGDAVLLEQVLVNLLDNAAKYAPVGSTIIVAAFAEEGGVRIEVRDEGSGIPEADLERVFEKFYRGRAADRRPAGTGLGLTICRGFVEALGGRLRAENRQDRAGARLIVAFPRETLVPALGAVS